MKNEEKYNFKDFTFVEYEKLLQLARLNHEFIFYDAISTAGNYVLWRHDIDVSVKHAFMLSEIEKRNGVKATYFLHLHNSYYNLFEKETAKTIQAIINNGHQIGLHLDCEFFPLNNENDLNTKIEFEKKILEEIFGTNINAFSFHNPSESILRFNKNEYCGLINTYGIYFKDINYASDSNGYWRHKSIKQSIEESKSRPIQVLTHPEWWVEKVMSPKERIYMHIDTNATEIKSRYSNGLTSYGREDIDW